jgi:hypothetical protein
MDGKVIGVILSLITIIGAAFGVDNFYMRKAQAADFYAEQQQQMQRDRAEQERDKIEVELQVIRLELEFLTSQYQDLALGELAKEKLRERKQYLRKREEILEQRQMALRDKL